MTATIYGRARGLDSPLSMTTPASRRSRPSARSPKEDGEIGETAQDVLIRHPFRSPGMNRIVKALREHEPELSPQVAAGMGRLLSAALSPMEGKAEPKDAKEALNIIATKMLPERRQQQRELDARQERELRRLQREAAAALEAANMEAGERAMARRPAVGSPERVVRKKRNNYGYMVDA